MNKKILLIIAMITVAGGAFWLYKNNVNITKKYSGPVEDANLKLKWLHQAQFAGNYVAKEKGFYKDQGINLNIIPFSFEDPVIKSVSEGRDVFGITGADELVLARSKGIPIKAIAVIYKINPVAAYSLKTSGITKPQDFIGKTVGI